MNHTAGALWRLVMVVLALILCLLTVGAGPSEAPPEHQEELLEGTVTAIISEEEIIPEGGEQKQLLQEFDVLVARGSLRGQTIRVRSGLYASAILQRYVVGDDLVIRATTNVQGVTSYTVVDYVRRGPLLGLAIIFMVITALVGHRQGLLSLAGMALSFAVILLYVLPQILDGADPVRTAILASLVIIPATYLLSHGVTVKTGVAMVGTLIALLITGLLARYYIDATRLTGFASEEAGFLQAYSPGQINIRGLILAGIIIGITGVLDDVTISQAAVIQQLKLANPSLSSWQLYRQAMSIGRDHIASMVNTLVLVYAGAALPLLLLFVDRSRPMLEVLNYEILVEEIVRTLVGSIGLIIAVPITTALAAWVSRYGWFTRQKS